MVLIFNCCINCGFCKWHNGTKSITISLSSVLCVKAVATASCMEIALSHETCLLGGRFSLSPCWFHLQQIPELHLVALKLLPHSRNILLFFPPNPNLYPVRKGGKTVCPDSTTGKSGQWNINKSCSVGLLKLFWCYIIPPSCWSQSKYDGWRSGSLLGTMRELSRNHTDLALTSLRHWTKATNCLFPDSYCEKNKPFSVYATEGTVCYYQPKAIPN